MGLCKCLFRGLINFLIVFFVVILLPGLPPKTTFDFKAFTFTAPANLSGPLEVNNLLDNAERLYEGQVYGPECILKRGNDLFATINGGEVIKINGDHITHVAKFGKPCEGIIQEERCGRPLGMVFDTIGNNLIVADAYYGIWLVDLSNGRKTQLVSPNEELDGKIRRHAKIFNSVAVAKNGDIFWSDSSSDFGLHDGVFSLLANPSGRLFQYNRRTKQNKVLIDEVSFANGVALSPNEDFVVVSDLGQMRLLRYYLKGPKTGQSDIFVEGLPGIADNLTPDENGIWVPLVLSADSDHPFLFRTAANTPLVRKFGLRVLALIELPFKLIQQVFPNVYTETIVHKIGHFETTGSLSPDRQTILRLDWNGNIVGSLHGFDRSAHTIAHVLEDGDYLLLGSFSNKYIGRVKLPKSYKTAKTTTASTTTTTQRPTTTTTTPKPTTQAPRATTTTPKSTTTTTPKPTTQAPRATTTTTQKPKATEKPKAKTAEKSKEPAPIHESIKDDAKRPQEEKLKVIKKGGAQGEL